MASDLFPTSSEAPPGAVGLVIDGRYKILDLLGVGGMGAVYIAEHLTLHKQVALKVILAEFADNEEIAQRFTREAMATAQIDHPNVASALDYGTLPEGGSYLVTQLVRGHSLEHERTSVGKMPWRTVAHIGAQIADALSAAHAIHVVHRDLKPDNILLEPRDNGLFLVKVLDFGVARITQTAALPKSDLTRMGTVIGTPGYMAPEQAMGETITEKVDLYSLGVILWECLTGRSLWAGATLSDLFTSQLARPAPPIAKEIEGLPPELAAMIDMLLDRNPARRPESARHVREALRRLTHGTIAVGQTAPVIVRPAAASKSPLILGAVAIAGVAIVAITVTLAGGDKLDPAKTATTTAVDTPVPKDSPTPDAKAAAVPAALAGSLDVLLTSGDKKARKAAADAIAEYEPATDVPAFARNVASLERQTTCPGKLTLVERISADGDARALPALQLLEKTPRKGCDGDCLGCLREPLARAIGRLEK